MKGRASSKTVQIHNGLLAQNVSFSTCSCTSSTTTSIPENILIHSSSFQTYRQPTQTTNCSLSPPSHPLVMHFRCKNVPDKCTEHSKYPNIFHLQHYVQTLDSSIKLELNIILQKINSHRRCWILFLMCPNRAPHVGKKPSKSLKQYISFNTPTVFHGQPCSPTSLKKYSFNSFDIIREKICTGLSEYTE